MKDEKFYSKSIAEVWAKRWYQDMVEWNRQMNQIIKKIKSKKIHLSKTRQ